MHILIRSGFGEWRSVEVKSNLQDMIEVFDINAPSSSKWVRFDAEFAPLQKAVKKYELNFSYF